MNRQQTYNFSAGPSALPDQVLSIAQSELLDYNNTGTSVMEMSHRSAQYMDIFSSVKAKLKKLMNIPDSHEILFLQGGATQQFAMVPMNLIGEGYADYTVTGNFAASACKEAQKYGKINIAATTEDSNHNRIPDQDELKLDTGARYFYYCSNNTVYGTEWKYVPQTEAPLVCDMSSNILSKSVNTSDYGIIFAGAQKNMAPAGLTVVIIDKSLRFEEKPYTPSVMSYTTMIEKDSMLNTPSCYNIYLLGLVLDWIESGGGLESMEQRNIEKSGILYEFLDNSKLYKCYALPEARSNMNVTFTTGNPELDGEFCKIAAAHGLLNLKGHRAVGGIRASIYNAMTKQGVETLINYLKKFEEENLCLG